MLSVMGMIVASLLVLPRIADAQSFVGTIRGGVATASANAGNGARRGTRAGRIPPVGVRAEIGSLSSAAEIEALKRTGTMGQLLRALRRYDHGHVVIGGRSYPVHAAFRGARGNYVLVASGGAGGLAHRGTGLGAGTVGIITLRPSQRVGYLFVTQQALVWSGGTPRARAGRSAAAVIRNLRTE